jgi:hypothetical protein
MEKYLGVKLIDAEEAFRDFRIDKGNLESQIIPKDGRENDPDWHDGFKVIYEDGYVSWSPKEVFEKAYRRIDGLTFGLAIEALKMGRSVARKGWNGKDMFLKLNPSYPVNGFLNADRPDGPIYAKLDDNNPITDLKGGQMLSYIVIKTSGSSFYHGEGYSDYIPWVASQIDILAEDWFIIE